MKYCKLFILFFITQMGFSQVSNTKILGDFDAVKVFDKISVQLIPSDVRASQLVEAKVRAGGIITIFGKPKQINQKTVLGGSINQSNR